MERDGREAAHHQCCRFCEGLAVGLSSKQMFMFHVRQFVDYDSLVAMTSVSSYKCPSEAPPLPSPSGPTLSSPSFLVLPLLLFTLYHTRAPSSPALLHQPFLSTREVDILVRSGVSLSPRVPAADWPSGY
ncbi:hypothetical protein E2C01_035605 [Portunus trituberculatus]|uniref:Uncharacterized protein n=1 Tax=Portunus trituberculatus TaxID=210409 RepID=A0A5B7F6B0_PORTR|nr:hypothetical protein [Portunus trituberculatus]